MASKATSILLNSLIVEANFLKSLFSWRRVISSIRKLSLSVLLLAKCAAFSK